MIKKHVVVGDCIPVTEMEDDYLLFTEHLGHNDYYDWNGLRMTELMELAGIKPVNESQTRGSERATLPLYRVKITVEWEQLPEDAARSYWGKPQRGG